MFNNAAEMGLENRICETLCLAPNARYRLGDAQFQRFLAAVRELEHRMLATTDWQTLNLKTNSEKGNSMPVMESSTYGNAQHESVRTSFVF